jgi:hypothetical protein
MRTPKQQPTRAAPRETRKEWVASVNTHFQQTGAFRAKDIIRVLGNPLESVEVQTTPRASFSGMNERN